MNTIKIFSSLLGKSNSIQPHPKKDTRVYVNTLCPHDFQNPTQNLHLIAWLLHKCCNFILTARRKSPFDACKHFFMEEKKVSGKECMKSED